MVKVSFNSAVNGKTRIVTDVDFETVEKAQKYADELNYYYKVFDIDARVEKP